MCTTLAEFTFIPTTWNNTSHLSRCLISLLIFLGLTTGLSFYVFIANDGSDGSSLPLIHAIVQFFIAVIATLLFSIIPSGRMFGDRVAGKSCKYLASQTFTASYPSMSRNQCMSSIVLWLLVFGCKSVELYYYLVVSFTNTITAMAHMKIQGCNDRLFEYLEQLHPIKWENFVKDTKIPTEESAMFNGVNSFGNGSYEKGEGNKADDLPFYAVGFKSSSPEFTLRTRIWASLRAQTL
ncbi:unnamed protein product [Rhizoctonia solani]|uniref:1,3-beta-glucan synthase n=2 Tax=Rhizoctonia solani TaxID=456999 RepID=A0A8H3B826_9AGAM